MIYKYKENARTVKYWRHFANSILISECLFSCQNFAMKDISHVLYKYFLNEYII